MLIQVPRRLTRQPKGRAAVLTNSALGLDLLCAAANPATRYDTLLGLPYTQDGTYAYGVSSVGQGFASNGSSSAIWLPIPVVTFSKFTLVGIFQSNSNAVDVTAMGLGYSASTDPVVRISSGTSNAAKVLLWARNNAFSTPGTLVSSTASGFDGTLHTIAITFDGAQIACYIDGRLDSTNAMSSGSFTVDRFCIGALRRSSTGSWWSGTTFLGAAWKRDLSAAEIAQFSADPWQIFRASSSVIFTEASSFSGAVTSNQVTSTSATATVSMDATSTANQAMSATATATVSMDTTGTANQAISGSAVASVDTPTSATANQVTSASATATVSMDATGTANQVTSAQASALGELSSDVTSNQVTSVNAAAAVSTDTSVTSNQTTSASSTAAVSMALAVTSTQVTSAAAVAVISITATVEGNQVTSASAVSLAPLDATATMAQVISVTGTLRVGAEAPSPWQRLVVKKEQQALAKPTNEQVIITT